MAKKFYRVNYGNHSIPNPDYKPGSDDPIRSHVNAGAGSIIELDEERAEAFTKSFGGYAPKLSETTDKPKIIVVGGGPSNPLETVGHMVPKEAPPAPKAEAPKAQAPATSKAEAAPAAQK